MFDDFWSTSFKGDYLLIKEYAKDHRKNPTDAEQAMWELLRKTVQTYKFRRQHIIGDYIADFVCLSEKLIIEIDGGYHNEKSQINKDSKRSKWLEAKGLRVIRFTNEEVLHNSKEVILKLREILT